MNRNRRRYTPTRRGEVARVRKEGACESCKKRKVKCRKGEWGCVYAIQRIQSFSNNQHLPSNAGLGSQFNTHIHAPRNMNEIPYSTTTPHPAPSHGFISPNQCITPQPLLIEYLNSGDVEQPGRIVLGGVGSRTEEGSRDRMSPKLEDLVKTIDGTERSTISLANIRFQDVSSTSFGLHDHVASVGFGNDRTVQHQQWGVNPASLPDQGDGGDSVPAFKQNPHFYGYSDVPVRAVHLLPHYDATKRHHSHGPVVPSVPFQVRTVERTNSWERSVQLHSSYPYSTGSPYATDAVVFTSPTTNINTAPAYAMTSQFAPSTLPTYDVYDSSSIQDHFYPSPSLQTTPYLQAPPHHKIPNAHYDGSIYSPRNHPSNASDKLLFTSGIDFSGTPSLAIDQASLSSMSRLEIHSNHGEQVPHSIVPSFSNFNFTNALENWSPREFELETPPNLKGLDLSVSRVHTTVNHS